MPVRRVPEKRRLRALPGRDRRPGWPRPAGCGRRSARGELPAHGLGDSAAQGGAHRGVQLGEHGVVRGGDHGRVQCRVGLDERVDPAAVPGGLALGERAVERRQVFRGTPQRGEPGGLHLEGAAYLDDLGHPVVAESAGDHRCQFVGGHHVGAGALPALQHPGVHQGTDRLADRVAPDAQRGDQLWLGGDAPADGPFAAEDPGAELLGGLPDPVAAGRHGGLAVGRHGGLAAGRCWRRGGEINRRWHWLHHRSQIHPMIVG